jgi:hypothetical protein
MVVLDDRPRPGQGAHDHGRGQGVADLAGLTTTS